MIDILNIQTATKHFKNNGGRPDPAGAALSRDARDRISNPWADGSDLGARPEGYKARHQATASRVGREVIELLTNAELSENAGIASSEAPMVQDRSADSLASDPMEAVDPASGLSRSWVESGYDSEELKTIATRNNPGAAPNIVPAQRPASADEPLFVPDVYHQ